MTERRKAKQDRRKTMREVFSDHAEQDRASFGEIKETMIRIESHIQTSNQFMESLAWISDISKGTKLLKRPSIWMVAFILGVVALMGGLKAMVVGIITWVTPK